VGKLVNPDSEPVYLGNNTMSKMKSFVPRPSEPEQRELTRRDRVLTAVGYSFACLTIALVLRGLFELWLRFHP
jgi:hypothetical protein